MFVVINVAHTAGGDRRY